jgi:hypothetical protein
MSPISVHSDGTGDREDDAHDDRCQEHKRDTRRCERPRGLIRDDAL